jgi:hypothetical protein
MSSELLGNEPQRERRWFAQQVPRQTRREAHPWARPFGKPGQRMIRDGNGWSVRIIHFPTGPEVVDVQGPLADGWKTDYDQLSRLGFTPEQATALIVLKSYQHAEGDVAERERERRRLAYVRYLVESGRLSDGVPGQIGARHN